MATVALAASTALTFFFGILLIRQYVQRQHAAFLFWGIGMFCSSIAFGEETFTITSGIWTPATYDPYIATSGLLVMFLGVGEAFWMLPSLWARMYAGINSLVGLYMTVVIFRMPPRLTGTWLDIVAGGNGRFGIYNEALITYAVVTGIGGGAILLGSLWSYRVTRRPQMLFIAGGIAIAAATAMMGGMGPSSWWQPTGEILGIFLIFTGHVLVPLVRRLTAPTVTDQNSLPS